MFFVLFRFVVFLPVAWVVITGNAIDILIQIHKSQAIVLRHIQSETMSHFAGNLSPPKD